MARREITLKEHPVFASVTGLANTTFDAETHMGDRMTTEGQVLQCRNEIIGLENRADACCRDLLFWEARVQIVRMNTNTKTNYGMGSVGGVVVSSFDENVQVGSCRRGLPYTVTFPIKWDNNLYVRNLTVHRGDSCAAYYANNGRRQEYGITEYRYINDGVMPNLYCSSGGARSGFWRGANNTNNTIGNRINYNNEWNSWLHEVADDGTVTLADRRRTENFTVIRFYTQWVLKECANGSVIEDNPDWT